MRLRSFSLAAVCVFAVAQVTFAQPPPGSAAAPPQPRSSTPTPAPDQARTPTPAAAPGPPAPRRSGQPLNVKVDVTISDQAGSASPALKKTVSVVTGDSMNGFIRSNAFYQELGLVPLNVDTEPEILGDGKIRLRVNLQYDLPNPARGGGDVAGAGSLKKTELRENLSLILESGKSIVAAQSADPVGDRQVTVEVKATILR
jgi:hypothetical protein